MPDFFLPLYHRSMEINPHSSPEVTLTVMKRACACLALYLVVALSGTAQEAPEAAANTIWEFTPTAGVLGPRFSLFLADNGLAYSLASTREPLQEPGRYRYRKTGAETGILELGESAEPVTVRFNGAASGTYQDRRSSGALRISRVPVAQEVPLRNLSSRAVLASGQSSMMGFVVGGGATRRVLVRVIGPALAQFAVANPAATPALTVWRGSSQFGMNRGWAGVPAVAEAATRVGAFTLPETSRDCALLLTLAAGDYVAQATAEGSGGEVLLEVYFVD